MRTFLKNHRSIRGSTLVYVFFVSILLTGIIGYGYFSIFSVRRIPIAEDNISSEYTVANYALNRIRNELNNNISIKDNGTSNYEINLDWINNNSFVPRGNNPSDNVLSSYERRFGGTLGDYEFIGSIVDVSKVHEQLSGKNSYSNSDAKLANWLNLKNTALSIDNNFYKKEFIDYGSTLFFRRTYELSVSARRKKNSASSVVNKLSASPLLREVVTIYTDSAVNDSYNMGVLHMDESTYFPYLGIYSNQIDYLKDRPLNFVVSGEDHHLEQRPLLVQEVISVVPESGGETTLKTDTEPTGGYWLNGSLSVHFQRPNAPTTHEGREPYHKDYKRNSIPQIYDELFLRNGYKVYIRSPQGRYASTRSIFPGPGAASKTIGPFSADDLDRLYINMCTLESRRERVISTVNEFIKVRTRGAGEIIQTPSGYRYAATAVILNRRGQILASVFPNDTAQDYTQLGYVNRPTLNGLNYFWFDYKYYGNQGGGRHGRYIRANTTQEIYPRFFIMPELQGYKHFHIKINGVDCDKMSDFSYDKQITAKGSDDKDYTLTTKAFSVRINFEDDFDFNYEDMFIVCEVIAATKGEVIYAEEDKSVPWFETVKDSDFPASIDDYLTGNPSHVVFTSNKPYSNFSEDFISDRAIRERFLAFMLYPRYYSFYVFVGLGARPFSRGYNNIWFNGELITGINYSPSAKDAEGIYIPQSGVFKRLAFNESAYITNAISDEDVFYTNLDLLRIKSILGKNKKPEELDTRDKVLKEFYALNNAKYGRWLTDHLKFIDLRFADPNISSDSDRFNKYFKASALGPYPNAPIGRVAARLDVANFYPSIQIPKVPITARSYASRFTGKYSVTLPAVICYVDNSTNIASIQRSSYRGLFASLRYSVASGDNTNWSSRNEDAVRRLLDSIPKESTELIPPTTVTLDFVGGEVIPGISYNYTNNDDVFKFSSNQQPSVIKTIEGLQPGSSTERYSTQIITNVRDLYKPYVGDATYQTAKRTYYPNDNRYSMGFHRGGNPTDPSTISYLRSRALLDNYQYIVLGHPGFFPYILDESNKYVALFPTFTPMRYLDPETGEYKMKMNLEMKPRLKLNTQVYNLSYRSTSINDLAPDGRTIPNSFDDRYLFNSSVVPNSFVFDKDIDGAGILIVNGNLQVKANFSYYGTLIVTGNIIVGDRDNPNKDVKFTVLGQLVVGGTMGILNYHSTINVLWSQEALTNTTFRPNISPPALKSYKVIDYDSTKLEPSSSDYLWENKSRFESW